MLDAISNFHFVRPVWLLLMPVVVAIWWAWQRSSDPLRGWRQQIDPDLLAALVSNPTKQRSHPFTLVFWLVASVAIAGPTWRMSPSPFADDAAPLVILLKAGISMDHPIPAPSRIERARLKINDLADARKGQPLALIAYAGSSHLVLPPTKDTAVVAQMATEISPEIMPLPGDRLDLALQTADRLLHETGGGILVIADSYTGSIDSLPNLSRPIQILSLAPEGSSEAGTIDATGKALRAKVTPLTTDSEDITKIAGSAARLRMNQTAESGARWQEAGYWLIPLLAGASALSFRRETREVSQ